MEIKQSLAEEAVRIVSGARRAAYGKPEQNFERIARLWNAHMLNTAREGNLTPVDVATFCRLIKEARLAETPDHRDSFVDILGYTLCQAEIALVQEVESPPLSPASDDMRDAITYVQSAPALSMEEQNAIARMQQDAISQSWADAALEDSAPAWKRAKAGDVVSVVGHNVTYKVHAIDDASPTQRVQLDMGTFYYWVENSEIREIVERAA